MKKSQQSAARDRSVKEAVMKTKEDKGEEKHLKKKKSKKGKDINCPVHDVTQGVKGVEVKKGKKCKDIETVVIEEESLDECGAKERKEMKKKTKKMKNVNKLLNGDAVDPKNILSASTDETIEKSKEKKKKKKTISEEESPEADVTKEEHLEASTANKVKTQKKIKRNAQMEQDENGKETPKTKGNKKCQAEKKAKTYVPDESETVMEDVRTEEKKKSKKEKAKRKSVEVREEEEVEPKKKKRKKEQPLIMEGDSVATESDTVKKIKKKMRKQEGKGKKWKKETSPKDDELLSIQSEEIDVNGNTEKSHCTLQNDTNKGTKKKKVKQGENEKKVNGKTEKSEVPAQSDTKKKTTKKKVKHEEEHDAVVKTGVKKKKKKRENSLEEEQQSLKVCKGNEMDGNSSDTTVAAQNDTRKKIQRKKVRGEEVDVGDKIDAKMRKIKDEVVEKQGLGQWSTVEFDSSARQQKFLRLMGGFKKGFQPAAAGNGAAANMALGKDAQQQLQQGLQGQFERAHSRRMDFSNKGAGLGFSPPSNKKFSIDVNASRSIRFDDL